MLLHSSFLGWSTSDIDFIMASGDNDSDDPLDVIASLAGSFTLLENNSRSPSTGGASAVGPPSPLGESSSVPAERLGGG